MSDPGYIADHVDPGDTLQVILPDGTTRSAVVLEQVKSGKVTIDFVDWVAELEARQGTWDGDGVTRPVTAPVLASAALTAAAVLSPLPVLIVAAAAAWVATAVGTAVNRRGGR